MRKSKEVSRRMGMSDDLAVGVYGLKVKINSLQLANLWYFLTPQSTSSSMFRSPEVYQPRMKPPPYQPPKKDTKPPPQKPESDESDESDEHDEKDK